MSLPPYPPEVPDEGQPLPAYPAGDVPLPAQQYAGADPLISPDFSGWWQRGTAIARTSWRPLLTLQLIGAVVAFVMRGPTGVYQAIVARDLTNSAAGTTRATLSLGPLLAGTGLSLLGVILMLLVSALVTLASVHVVVASATGVQLSVGDALRGGVRRLMPLIGWQLLASLIIVAGACACLLPGIYFGAVFAVLAPIVAFERVNPIGRSFKLFHGNLAVSTSRIATIFGVFLGVAIVAGIVGIIVSAATHQSTASTATLVVGQLFVTLIAVVFGAVVGVVTGPLTVTAYADMRSRLEPLSTAVLVHEVQAA